MHNRDADAAGLLTFLADRYDLKSATREDLEFLSRAGENAFSEALSLSEQVSGIASLIASDADGRPVPQAGSFRGDSQSHLLWKIAREIEVIGQMAHIGSEADYELRARVAQLTARPTKESSRASSTKQSSSEVSHG
ncbi:hypothetical protein [Burkholderia sp. PR2]|uniref:hypothetical protein n=1 Tax=Burkholderia sp. PR2 TaxID=3448078 RepID=UPI00402A9606